MKTNDELLPPLKIDPQSLSPETLIAVMESFILREGTDYGTIELSLDKKLENLHRKLKRKEVLLVFDPNTESVTFLTPAQYLLNSAIGNKPQDRDQNIE